MATSRAAAGGAGGPERPPSLTGKQRCTQLSASRITARRLPARPPAGLEELETRWGCSRLPPALAAATQLRRLALGSGCWISHADVDQVLRHLQRLAALELDSWSACMTPDVIAHLLRSLPALRAPTQW